MFAKISRVFFSKILVSVLGFFIVILNAKQLGAEGLGVISLIFLCITYNQVVCGLIGGATLMYLASRKPLLQLLLPSYVWAVVSSLVCTLVLRVLHLIPGGYATDVFLLSVLQALGTIHLNLFIGLEKIKKYNWINSFQVLIGFAALLFLFYAVNEKTIRSYLISLYLGFAYVFLASSRVLLPLVKFETARDWAGSLRTIVENSVYIQLATIIHLMNCRLSYFFLDGYMDKASLGIYSTAVSIAESLWLINRSISVVQFSNVVNSDERRSSQALTLSLAKFSFVLTLFFAVVMLLIPEDFYVFIFGQRFNAIKHTLFYLLPGIAVVANSSLYVHYYAAIGKNHINTIGSTVGFVFTLLCCLLLIPRYHLAGAAIGSTVSYLASALFMIVLFKREAGLRWNDFWIKRTDTGYMASEIKKLFSFG
jgi:O-antigen/teichoic acid export membrane protein